MKRSSNFSPLVLAWWCPPDIYSCTPNFRGLEKKVWCHELLWWKWAFLLLSALTLLIIIECVFSVKVGVPWFSGLVSECLPILSRMSWHHQNGKVGRPGKTIKASLPLLLCYFNSLAKKGCHKNRLQKLYVYLIGACLKVWNGGFKLEDWLLKNLGGYQLIGSHFSSR